MRLTISPGVVTANGQPVPVTGGPWTLGGAVIRVAGAYAIAPQSLHQWSGTAWTKITP